MYNKHYGEAHNRESSRKGMYLRHTSTNRPTMKTRRARPMSARMRRDTKGRYRCGNNVRREDRNTCHAVKAGQIYGLKRSAEGVGGRRAIFRKTQERKQGTLTNNIMSGSATLDMEGLRGAIGWTVKEQQPRREEVRKRRGIGRKAEEKEPETRENKEHCLKQCQGPQGWTWKADVGPSVKRKNYNEPVNLKI